MRRFAVLLLLAALRLTCLHGQTTIAPGPPDMGAAINAVLANATDCPTDSKGYQHCVIILPVSQDGAWSTQATVTSPYVSIVGQGKSQSYFSCTANGDCLRAYTNPFTTQSAGTYKGFSLDGSGTTSGVGFHFADMIGENLIDLGAYNFTGSSGAGFWFDNANIGNALSGTWSERILGEGLESDNNFIDLRFTNELANGGNPSFGYNRFLDVNTNANSGQTAVSLEDSVQLYNGTLRLNDNACDPNPPFNCTTAAAAIIALTGTALFQGELHLTGEGPTYYLFKGASATRVTLTQDSAVTWGGTPSAPPSNLGSGSGILLGPTFFVAPPDSPSPLIPSLPIISQDPITAANPSATESVSSNGDIIVAQGTSGILRGTFTISYLQPNNNCTLIVSVGSSEFDTIEYNLNVLSNYCYDAWAGSGYISVTNPKVVMYATTTPQLVVTLSGVTSGTLAVSWLSDGYYPPPALLPVATEGSSISNAYGMQQDSLGDFAFTNNLSANNVTTSALSQKAAANTGGTCRMSSGTTCTLTISHSYATPVCIATQQSPLTIGAAGCTVSGTTVTVKTTTDNSGTWGVLVFGNPN